MFEQNLKDEPRDYRKELWIKVVVAVASASNATRPSSMHEWADKALAEYDKRFPQGDFR